MHAAARSLRSLRRPLTAAAAAARSGRRSAHTAAYAELDEAKWTEAMGGAGHACAGQMQLDWDVRSGLDPAADGAAAGRTILDRAVTQDVMRSLAPLAAEGGGGGVPAATVLTGGKGVGKSAVLNHLAYWAHSQGWLTLFVHNGWELVNGGLFVQPCDHDSPLSARGLFDTPLLSRQLLLRFAAQASDGRCDGLALKAGAADDASLLGRLGLDAGAPLTDLLALGAADLRYSTDAAVELVRQLRLVDEVPVVVLVDEYSSWFGKSGFMYAPPDAALEHYAQLKKHHTVHASQFAVVDALKGLTEDGLVEGRSGFARGAAVYGVSTGRPLNRASVKAVGGAVAAARDAADADARLVRVAPYSRDEFKLAVEAYAAAGLADGFTPAEFADRAGRVEVEAQRNPRATLQAMGYGGGMHNRLSERESHRSAGRQYRLYDFASWKASDSPELDEVMERSIVAEDDGDDFDLDEELLALEYAMDDDEEDDDDEGL